VRRGEGIGTALLRHRLDRVRGPAYLESSKHENLALYERFGFVLRETIHLPDGPDLWPMWRTG
jgi:GNAT superfamily N-acetyltransferase